MSRKVIFLFDLDGTVTRVETLPWCARRLGLPEDVVKGLVPYNGGKYEENLRRRLRLLECVEAERVAEVIAETPLYEEIARFIRGNRSHCAVVTSNLGCYVSRLVAGRLGCGLHASTSSDCIIAKASIVERYKAAGWATVMIGDGGNDLAAMRVADKGIAFSAEGNADAALQAAATWTARSEGELLRLLERCWN